MKHNQNKYSGAFAANFSKGSTEFYSKAHLGSITESNVAAQA